MSENNNENVDTTVWRYDIDSNGYITNMFLGCYSGTCLAYEGSVPSGYTDMDDFVSNANIKAYKIVNGELVYDSNKDAELQAKYKIESSENEYATKKYVNEKLNKNLDIYDDELSSTIEGSSLITIENSGNYEIPKIKITSNGSIATKAGEEVIIEDNYGPFAQKLKIDGKTVLGGIPSPNNRVMITNFGVKMGELSASEIDVFGKNQIDSVSLDLQGEQLCSINKARNVIDDITITETTSIMTKRIGNTAFFGDEKWGRYNTSDGHYRYILKITDDIKAETLPSQLPNLTSDLFPTISPNQSWIGVTGITLLQNSKNIAICYESSQTDTLEKFKNWLSNNFVTLYYELINEINIPLESTPVPLFEEYNKIVTNDVLRTNLEVTYLSNKTIGPLNLSITNNNLLENKAISSTINGVTFTVNSDKTITLNGTATENTELILNGSLLSEDILFFLKGNQNYRVCTFPSNVKLNLYYHSGEDTEMIYSGSNGTINIEETKYITRSTISVQSGTSFTDIVVYPMIQVGAYENIPYEYVTYSGNNLIKMDFTTDFTTMDYIELNRSNVTLIKDDLTEIDLALIDTLYTFNPNTVIQCDKKTSITVIYFGNNYLNNKFTNIETTFDDINLTVGNKVGKDEIISSINLSPETIKLKSNKIQLEGYTTINDGFSVDAIGNVSMKNASLTGGNSKINIVANNTLDDAIIIKGKFGSLDTIVKIGNYLSYYTVFDNDGSILTQTTISGGKVSAPVIEQTSLERIKKNFEIFNGGLSLVMNSDVYKYHLKTQDDSDKKHIGLVIGDSYNTPDEVVQGEGIDLYSMISVAWQSIKEQQQEIEELKERLDQLGE